MHTNGKIRTDYWLLISMLSYTFKIYQIPESLSFFTPKIHVNIVNSSLNFDLIFGCTFNVTHIPQLILIYNVLVKRLSELKFNDHNLN